MYLLEVKTKTPFYSIKLTSHISNSTWPFVAPFQAKKKKKKIVVLPSRGISEYLGGLVGRKYSFFLIIFLKSTQKYQIWVHFPPFFSKKVKNHSICQKLGAFPTLFFYFIFWDGSVTEGTQDLFLDLMRKCTFNLKIMSTYIIKGA